MSRGKIAAQVGHGGKNYSKINFIFLFCVKIKLISIFGKNQHIPNKYLLNISFGLL